MGAHSPLATVATVNAAIASAPSVEAALAAALRPLLGETGAEADEVFLLVKPQQEMMLAAHSGLHPEAFHQITRFGLGQGFPGIVAASGQRLLTHHLEHDPRYLRTRVKELGFRHYLCLPLQVRGEVAGCLNLAGRRPFAPGAAQFCQAVAHPLALALDRATLAVQERLARAALSLDRAGPPVENKLKEVACLLGAEGAALFWGQDLRQVARWGRGVAMPAGQRPTPCPSLLAGRAVCACPEGHRCGVADPRATPVCLGLRGPYGEEGVVGLVFQSAPPPYLLSLLPAAAEYAGIMFGSALAGTLSPQEAVARERRRLAQELHDGLAHSIGLVAQQAELLVRIARRDPQAAQGEAAALRRTVQNTLEELRSTVEGVPPPALDSGLETALRRLAASFSRYYDVEVRFQAVGNTGQLPSGWALPLYRIAQEGTANAIRHGSASEVQVWLAVEPPLVSLTVQDNGAGFSPPPAPTPGHRGLAHMRKRAQALGGDLRVESSPGQGTTITLVARLPSQRQG